MNAHSGKIIANSLAVLVILGFITVIANSLRISMQTSDTFGPTVLATDAAGNIYINVATTLYVLDTTGRLTDSIPLENLGLQGVTLTDLLALPGGRLLIGSSDTQHIHTCDLAQRNCTPFIQSATRPVSAFKMAWDEQRQRLLVVDGERHRILVYDRNGVLTLESKGGEHGLRLPNTVSLAGDGKAIIADTNHHRLVALDAQTLSSELWEMPVSNQIGKLRRIWPTDFVQASDQRYWVILDNDLLENGDVIVFDAAGKAVLRLSLPSDWDPIKLRPRTDDVLLAGYASVNLVSISLDGQVITPFGDAAFRGMLAEIRAQRRAADRWWQGGIWMAMVPLVILAGIAAWLDRKRRTAVAPSVATAPAEIILPETGQGVYWLEPDPKIVRLLRYSRWLVYLVGILLLLPAIYIVWWAGPEKSAALVAPLLAGGIAFLAILVTGLNTLSRGRLGVTRDQVVLATGGRPQRHYYPRQLVYSSGFISSGEVTVYLRTGKGPIYNPGEVRDYLEPLLAMARKLNPLQGYIYLLQTGDRQTWINTLGITCLAGLYLYSEFFAG
jgi:sugar lactone lactonase YvrE